MLLRHLNWIGLRWEYICNRFLLYPHKFIMLYLTKHVIRMHISLLQYLHHEIYATRIRSFSPTSFTLIHCSLLQPIPSPEPHRTIWKLMATTTQLAPFVETYQIFIHKRVWRARLLLHTYDDPYSVYILLSCHLSWFATWNICVCVCANMIESITYIFVCLCCNAHMDAVFFVTRIF